MRTKNKPIGQKQNSFIEETRRTQIIECAIETLATLGYAQASLAQIAKRAGVSKGVIIYYFVSKEELFEQVVKTIFMEGAHSMGPLISAQLTTAQMLRIYIQTNVEYIGTHRLQMMALREIALNFRTQEGEPRFRLATEGPILETLEALLRKGQQNREFRDFDVRVMAVTIRRSIDTLPSLLSAEPNLDVKAYGLELSTLFDRATALSTEK